ncbi:hypothetical protein FACS1894206_06770 [Deltaproteobacteria bacterium]|nr:hypothetical protein FACS1894206_06770 [Deltaproteobacteria bacterium]
MNNLFAFPDALRQAEREYFEPIVAGEQGFCVTRIVSHGQTTPEGEWYDQDDDEWVLVLEGDARLAYEDGVEISLRKGGHVFLPRHCKHRVTHTSSPCIWLAVHGNLRKLPYLSGTDLP